MKTSKLDATQITIQDFVTATTNYTLTGGVFSSARADDSTILYLTLTRDDLNALKVNYLAVSENGLAESNGTTWLTHTAGAFTDMNDVPVVPIVDGNATQVKKFTPDTTRPILERFDLDLNVANNLATLKLWFSEIVNEHTFDFTKITFQDGPSATGQSHRLTAGGQHAVGTCHLQAALRQHPFSANRQSRFAYSTE